MTEKDKGRYRERESERERARESETERDREDVNRDGRHVDDQVIRLID